MRTEEVRRALRQHFGGEGAVVMEEVGNSTGHDIVRRWCDMLVMQTWPSRGFDITGVEIKVSRQDWLGELAKPQKAEVIHRHCDFWCLAVGPGVLKDGLAEVPERWGVVEVTCDLEGKAKVTIARRPQREERKGDIARPFVAAMLRAMKRNDDRAINAEIEAEVQRRVEERRRIDAETRRDASARVARMLDALGEEARFLDGEQAARAVALVIRAGLASGWDGLGGILAAVADAETRARDLRVRVMEEMERLGVAVPEHARLALAIKPKRRRA